MHLRHLGSYLCFIFCLWGLLIQPLRGQVPDSALVASMLAEGDLYYQRLDNQLALNAYGKALEHAPDSYDVLRRLSRTHNEYGMDLEAEELLDEAEESYEASIKYASELELLFPDSAHTHYLLAYSKLNIALLKGGREKVRASSAIERHCLKGLDIDHTDAELNVLYGVFIREMAGLSWMERTLAQALVGDLPEGDKEEALGYIEQAIELDPTLHIAHFEAGLTYHSVGRRAKAITHLENAEMLPAQTTQDNRNRQLAIRMLERLKKE